MHDALLVFVRPPELGKVKTRLAATLGNAAALAIYKRLLQHTASATLASPAHKFVFYSGHVVQADEWQAGSCTKLLQEEADLGRRMKAAFEHVFSKGFRRVVIIGSDCPGLSASHIDQAFLALGSHDVVIGPAVDGGYYLLGMKSLHPQLFENKSWSSPVVYTETMDTVRLLKLSCSLLEPLADIDEEADLPEGWRRELLS